MYSNSIPWKVLSSHVGTGILTEGWSLAEPTDSDSPRTFIVDVYFDSPFYATPVVQLGLTGFDIDQRDSARLSLRAENITLDGFQAIISTWDATRVFSVEFNWLAIGP